MSARILQPTRGSVTLDTSQMPNNGAPSTPGLGQRASLYGQQQNDAAGQLRMIVEGNMQGSGGGGNTIRWENYGDSRYEDPALREIREGTSVDQDIERMYVDKFARASIELLQQLIGRRGMLYEEYRGTLENFRHNRTTGVVCEIRNAFVNTLTQHPEMIRGIAHSSVPLFGQRCIMMAKNNATGELSKKDYCDAAVFAYRCVLTLEMISWLCKHPMGRQYAFRLTQEINGWIANLESFKDIVTQAATTFNLSNPYATLIWDVKPASRTDTALIAEAQTAYLYHDYTRDQGVAHSSAQSASTDLQLMIRRNAEASRRNSGRYIAPQETPVNAFGEVERWDRVRNDIQNLTRDNMAEFELRRYFYPIGKANHYFIPESDWKKIQHVFMAHEDQPYQEETVIRGSFRIVIIDLDDDSRGWFSTVVRAEDLDVQTVLTNPAKLLPFLEANDDQTEVVSPLAIEDALKGRKKGSKDITIPVEVCEELVGIPLVTVKDTIVSGSSKKLMAALETTNTRMTEKLKETNATSFKAVLWDTFTLASADDKVRLKNNLPFLFQDVEPDEKVYTPEMARKAYYYKVKKVAQVIEDNYLDEELAEFIQVRLTNIVNNWFVSCLGCDRDKHSANHLSVSNILEDFDELDKYLEQHEPEGYQWFNAPAGPTNYLTESMKLFVFEDKYESTESEGDAGIFAIQKDQELILERQMSVTMVNKRQGPFPDTSNEPVIIKRSKFPEYFDLVEKGFAATMGDAAIETTDKLIQFEGGEHLWVFNYSAFDRNTATLRVVDRRPPLVFLALL